jgi:IS1 family transposase
VEQTVSYIRPHDLRWSLKKRVTFFGEAIPEAAKNHVGMVRTQKSGQCWMTPALKAAMKRRNLLGCHIGRNMEQWLEACREVCSLMRCAKQNSWRTFMESMKGKTSLSHVWSVIPSLQKKRLPPMARNTVLEHGGKSFVSDTAKADVFIKHYASVNRHKFSRAERKTDCVMHSRLTEERSNPEPLGPESDNFLMEE